MMYTITAAVLFTLFTATDQLKGTTKPIKLGQFPYIAWLSDKQGGTCLGAIIEAEYVLTAAHCLDQPAASFVVRAGFTYAPSGRYEAKVRGKEMFITEECNLNAIEGCHDVGVLKLNASLTFSKNLSKVGYEKMLAVSPGLEGQVVGWGKTYDSNGTKVKDLEWGMQKVLSPDDCKLCFNPANEFGAFSDEFSLTEGDSGTPFVHNGEVVGVLSRGKSKKRGSIYTLTSAHFGFIRQHVHKKNKL